MGLITGLTQLFTDLGQCMSFFGSMFSLLPLAIQLLIYFAFGGLLLLGLMKIILGGV